MRDLVAAFSLKIVCLTLLVACASAPKRDQLITSAASGTIRIDEMSCTGPRLGERTRLQGSAALDPAGFDLMTWNLHKAEDTGWRLDLERLGNGQDLILLQEAHLTPAFSSYLKQSSYHWSMARAFDLGGAETGVLTSAVVPSSGACLTRTLEPLIRLPKSILVTRYPLNGERDELLVANVHGVNFTLGTTHFRAQLESLAETIRPHIGPVILAGDFNSWSIRRSDVLFEITRELGMVPLMLTNDARSRHWGLPVDFVFYRGVEVVDARSLEVSSSDHNPILVTFRMPEYPWEGIQR